MKKIIAVVCALVLVFMLCACGEDTYTVDYGTSQMYTKEDIDKAADIVAKTINSFGGCDLHSLTFAGDDECKEELSYVNDLVDDADVVYDECLVLNSEFRSPLKQKGAWEVNEIYTWSWYLGRENGGKWVLETYGY